MTDRPKCATEDPGSGRGPPGRAAEAAGPYKITSMVSVGSSLTQAG